MLYVYYITCFLSSKKKKNCRFNYLIKKYFQNKKLYRTNFKHPGCLEKGEIKKLFSKKQF